MLRVCEMDDHLRQLISAAKEARDVLRLVAADRRRIGPLATKAQSASWQLSDALNHIDEPSEPTERKES